MNDYAKQKKEAEMLGARVIGVEEMIIPVCCREGWVNCPHVVKKQKPVKKNIGL